MRKLLNIAIIGAVVCMAAACDPVAEDNRLIYVKPADVKRNVLIEDFTGQRCVNCPVATAEIEKLQEQYGADVVIAVGIHSGPFGHRTTMASARLSLCTETGDEYYTHWGITSQPGVIINRGTPIYNTAKYRDEVNKALEQSTPLQLDVEIGYTAETRRLDIDVAAMANTGLSGKLQVWLVENNVVAQQSMPDGSMNNDYVHQHVFRTSVNADIYGDDLTIAEGLAANKSYSITLDDSWLDSNVAVVAFVSNASSGVLQVVKKNIIDVTNE